MVKIMLDSMPQQHKEVVSGGNVGLARGGQSQLLQQGGDGGWSQASPREDSTSYPSECILWCTIALGALVQGCSSEFVSPPHAGYEADICLCGSPTPAGAHVGQTYEYGTYGLPVYTL